MNRLKVGSILLGVATFFIGCATNPVTGKKQIALMSEAQEIAMGQEADPQVVAQFGIYGDSAIQRYMRTQGQRMAAISHRPNLKYTFRVLDSDVLNAFAVPGGYVYLTRQILAYMNDEAQFNGVLGHEIGHIAYRHSVSQQTKQTLGQIGVIGAAIFVPNFGQYAQTAMQGLGLLMLKYDRNAEMEADGLGVEYSSKIGYDAHEMAKFFLTLKRQGEKSNSQIPEFLSTHPDPGNRYERVNQLATDYQKTHNMVNPTVGRDNYLRLLDGMVVGEDPRQGYLENNVFYHPEMRFQFSIPQGWKYMNSPQAVQIQEPNGQAGMTLTMAQGTDPAAAAQALAQQANLQVLQSQNTTVNGLPAYAMVVRQTQQTDQGNQSVDALVYMIKYNNAIYQILGMTSSQAFSTYFNTFQSVAQSFRQLTDQAKINKKPTRIRLKNVPANGTFQQALISLNVPAADREETALLNGVEMNTQVTKGLLIKVFGQ